MSGNTLLTLKVFFSSILIFCLFISFFLGVQRCRRDKSGSYERELVEICNEDDNIGLRHARQEADGVAGPVVPARREAGVGRPRPPRSANCQDILKFFYTYFPTPTLLAPKFPEWYNDPMLITTNTTKIPFKDATDHFEREMSQKTLRELYDMLTTANPLFGELIRFDRYETRANSLALLKRFLMYQFDHDEIEFSDFLAFLYRLLDRKSGKKNCMVIYGPASSGKTYFVRIIKEALITSGQLLNPSRLSQFPFNNCINKRILVWDEPAYDLSSLEMLKTLFSGDDTIANKKYADFETITRTPIIVTANTYVFPRSDAFECRIEKVRFKRCPMLENLKYLHPLSIFDLFVEEKLL